MSDIRLQAIQGQDDPALPFQHPPQPARVGQAGGEQFVIAVEQVGNAALGDLHPARAQGGVDLRHAAVLTVAQHPDQGDDVQPELLLRQRQRALRLRPIGTMKTRAALVLAAADLQPQPHRAGQHHQMAAVLISQLHVPGVCQRSCPVPHQAASLILRSLVSRSGLRQTSPTGDQLRIWRDHRVGLAARASV
jgi:hypothetical protein